MKEIIIISCGPGLNEVRNIYGHSTQWVQDRCEIKNVIYSESKGYKCELPEIQDGTGWIITGSSKSTYEDLEWIVELEILIKKAVQVQKPILGICFGHQLIAQALGGKVEKNKRGWELGSNNVIINDKGRLSPIFSNILKDDYFYMSHQDVVVTLPKDSVELAYNDMGNQAYRIGDFIYGVQFHPEFSYDVANKYANLRYAKGMIKNKPKVLKSKTSYKIINNFIKILKGNV